MPPVLVCFDPECPSRTGKQESYDLLVLTQGVWVVEVTAGPVTVSRLGVDGFTFLKP